MKLTVLGSGTFMPELKRNNSSYLLEEGKEKIVFDFGRGAIDRLLQLKVNLIDLDKVFISHMHADHSSELISFMFVLRYYPKKKDLKKHYYIYGPKGIKERLIMILDGFGVNKKKTLKRIKIKELSDNKIVKVGKLKIKAFTVKHSKSRTCFSYRVEKDKKAFCYSGDSTDCTGLRMACKDVDLAVVESTLPKSYGMDTHINGEELGKLAQEVGIHSLLVTHVSDFYLPRVLKDIKLSYKGPVKIAKDLMEVKI